MHGPAMPVLGDSKITCKRTEPRLRKAISIPSVTSLVKGSWNWAGDTIHTYRDGLNRDQRTARAEIEDRKQVLYLRIKNVSRIPFLDSSPFSNPPAGRVVR
jgi:TAG lipase/steryl ester hydrolase/phospholipase A2/LPA acyltransferase